MSKSLIKTVDGIGIWVKDDVFTQKSFGIREYIGFSIESIIIGLILYECFEYRGAYYLSSFANSIEFIFIGSVIVIACAVGLTFIGSGLNLFMRSIPAYEIYPGSDNGIVIPKTNDPAKDQLAICRAAKEIECRCHEIAAKRAELDRIAARCK